MLNDRLAAYLSYFERLATQPSNRWAGFYLTTHEDHNPGLHFQLAFPCYALAALCLHPDAEADDQERCRTAIAAFIDRMLQRRVWASWSIEIERQGITPDPLLEGNLHYGGHLAMMIGLFEAIGGDQRYDEPFKLVWSSNDRFSYTHTTLVEHLSQQMRSSAQRGIECAPGRLSAAAMTHALWALALHDGLHESDSTIVTNEWLAFMQRHLVLRGPLLPGRGALSTVYLTRLRLAVPFSRNITDGWALAFLACLAPQLVQELAPRFLARIVRNGDQAYVPSAKRWRGRELADPALATGFGYLLAVELGETTLANALLAYADAQLQPSTSSDERSYGATLAAPYTTALFALGEAGGLQALHRLTHRAALTATTD